MNQHRNVSNNIHIKYLLLLLTFVGCILPYTQIEPERSHYQQNAFQSDYILYAQAEGRMDDPPMDVFEQVYYFEINDGIFESALRTTKKALAEAEEIEADLIILKLNTYGGRVDIADTISKRLLNTSIRTMVLIDNNAASAGALISISADSIYMVPGARIGAATVVNGADGTEMPDKYQSYMRATMRSVAERNGRNPEIAEAMVDESIEIKGVSKEGKTLTFTTEEAIKNDYCEGKVKDFDDLLNKLAIDKSKVKSFQVTSVEKVARLLLNPALRGILITIMITGIFFEVRTPGVGIPLLGALIAASLYFAPLYIDGLAANWEIALFVLGLILIAIEIFLVPGFGIPGISGILAILSSLVLSMIRNDFFDFTFSPSAEISSSLLVTMFGLLGAVALFFIIGGSFGKLPALGRLTLNASQEKSEGYAIDSYKKLDLIGKIGIAATDLGPSGKIEIDDEMYDALAEGAFIEQGDPVIVLEQRGNHILVRKSE